LTFLNSAIVYFNSLIDNCVVMGSVYLLSFAHWMIFMQVWFELWSKSVMKFLFAGIVGGDVS